MLKYQDESRVAITWQKKDELFGCGNFDSDPMTVFEVWKLLRQAGDYKVNVIFLDIGEKLSFKQLTQLVNSQKKYFESIEQR